MFELIGMILWGSLSLLIWLVKLMWGLLRFIGRSSATGIGWLRANIRYLSTQLAILSAVLFVSGSAVLGLALWRGQRVPSAPPAFAHEAEQDEADDAQPKSPAPVHFTIHLGTMMDRLRALPQDDQPEQLADWAALGTLMYSQLPAQKVRDAVFDRPPFRLPSLEEVYNFDYGPGRRITLSGRRVWLFYADSDPQPVATLARLADQVRAEQGVIPASFTLFRYSFDLAGGAIDVYTGPTLKGEELFSQRYGYKEATISSQEELGAWLTQVDDVSHVQRDGSRLVLGGRSFPESRTLAVELADVAALYQAHKVIRNHNARFRDEVKTDQDVFVDLFNKLVKAYNEQIQSYNSTFSEVRREAIADGSESGLFRIHLKDLGRLLAAYKLRLNLAREGEVSLQRQKEMIDLLDEKNDEIQQAIAAHLPQDQATRVAQLQTKLLPPAPGFSLDPQWDVAGLRRDLERLLKNPQSFLAEATALLEKSKAAHFDEAATPREVWAVRELLNADVDSAEEQRYRSIARLLGIGLPEQGTAEARQAQARKSLLAAIAASRAQLGQLVAPLRKSLSGEPGPHDDRTLPFVLFTHSLRTSKDKHAFSLDVLLHYVMARNEHQCARYDGPMQGTQIGMTLFYTDVMAKVWQSVDYHHSAPLAEVPGILTRPQIKLDPEYFEEVMRLPNTRIWFGSRPGSYHLSDDEEMLNFSHIATRVYSAGSDPSKPGEETLPAEASRLSINWWDRHYYKIADYEQQYHRQNQIMKWSVITGWLLAHEQTAVALGLDRVEVDHSQRFDRWFKEHPGLRFRSDIRLLPESRWLGKTECMERLRSYLFSPVSGEEHTMYMEGGVSLPAAHEWRAAKLGTRLESPVRRLGLASEGTSGRVLKFIKGTEAELLPTQSSVSAGARIVRGESARLRGFGSQLQAERFTTEVAREGSQVSVRVRLPDQHPLLSLTAEVGDSRVALRLTGWDSELAVMTKLKQPGSQYARVLAAEREFAPGRGRYVIETGDRVEVLTLRPPAEPGSAPEALRFTTEAVPEDAVLARSGRPSTGMERLLGRGADGSPLVAQSLKMEDANALLSKMRYQVLDRLPRPGAEHEGRVAQYFTDRPPPEGARAVRLATGDPALPEIQGRIAGDRLILERPVTEEAGVQKVFNEFASRLELTGEDLAALARDAGRGPAERALRVGRLARAEHPEGRAVIAFSDGEPQKLFEQFQDALQRGQLSELTRRLDREIVEQGAADLLWGRKTRSADLVAERVGGTAEANGTGVALDSDLLRLEAAALREGAAEGVQQRLLFKQRELLHRVAEPPKLTELDPVAVKETLRRLTETGGRVFIEQPLLAELPADGRVLEGLMPLSRRGHLKLVQLPTDFDSAGEISMLEMKDSGQTRRFYEARAEASAGRSAAGPSYMAMQVGNASGPSPCSPMDDPVLRQQCMLRLAGNAQHFN